MTEYIETPRQKLVEEAQEVAIADNNKLREELADVMEVIETLMTAAGIEPEKVREIQQEKRSRSAAHARSQRGGFDI